MVMSGDELKIVVVRAFSLSKPGQVNLGRCLKWDQGRLTPVLLLCLTVYGD